MWPSNKTHWLPVWGLKKPMKQWQTLYLVIDVAIRPGWERSLWIKALISWGTHSHNLNASLRPYLQITSYWGLEFNVTFGETKYLNYHILFLVPKIQVHTFKFIHSIPIVLTHYSNNSEVKSRVSSKNHLHQRQIQCKFICRQTVLQLWVSGI